MLYDFVEKCLKDLRPYLEPHWEIDHVCYRTKSLEDYVKTKNSFSKIGYLLGETCIGGRPIACFELHSPVMTSQGLVSLVEVPAPKPGRKSDSGYEHLEVVIDRTFEALMIKFPNLSWDTRAISKGFNNEIEAKFSDFNVKFHHHALNHIIEVEKNTDAYELVVQLQSFIEHSPQIAVPITELGINHLQAKSLDGWPTDTPRNIQYKFEMLETALDLTSRGFAKLLCPKFIVKIENERLNEKHKLVEQEQKIRFPKMKVYAVKKKSHPEDEYFKKLCKAVRVALQS